MTVNDIFRYISNYPPENLLRKTGLMEIVKSADYQEQLSRRLSSQCISEDALCWSEALLITKNWLDMICAHYDSHSCQENWNNWVDKINRGIKIICRSDDIELGMSKIEVRIWVFFWLAHYSLLFAITQGRFRMLL
ncbi:hypothetical protein [Candidatus Bathycorpusculum sp.]|uniref:hypothetical protein n=1 Tax=Candidatus Bathycorpusculum sp. TaxID=2994959 RepID=UPI0028220EE2|nr:hypothetical protein [Candidatus Termitimicrobium sp.]MCL2684990.1 hypothetical protein [Candidatus Termitimicrobium sp.]